MDKIKYKITGQEGFVLLRSYNLSEGQPMNTKKEFRQELRKDDEVILKINKKNKSKDCPLCKLREVQAYIYCPRCNKKLKQTKTVKNWLIVLRSLICLLGIHKDIYDKQWGIWYCKYCERINYKKEMK